MGTKGSGKDMEGFIGSGKREKKESYGCMRELFGDPKLMNCEAAGCGATQNIFVDVTSPMKASEPIVAALHASPPTHHVFSSYKYITFWASIHFF